MALVEMNWKPSRKVLRDFGAIALIMLILIAGLLSWKGMMSSQWALVLGSLGLLIFILSRVSVELVKPVYIVLLLITLPIGWVVSHLVMAIFYYGILTPVGLLFRLVRQDPLNRRFDPQAKSYWVPHRKADTSKRYFNQF